MADPEKIYPATPHKRNESREKGQVSKSNELTTTLALIAVLGFFFVAGYNTYYHLVNIMYGAFTAIDSQLNAGKTILIFLGLMGVAFKIIAPVMIVAVIVGILGNIFQIGLIFSAQPLQPQLSRINPISGFKRIMSMRGLFEAAKSIFKIVLIGYIVYVTIMSNLTDVLSLVDADKSKIAALFVSTIGRVGFQVFLRAALALLFLSIFDLLYQRWQHEQDIRMTREELREEMKRTEGDPEIRRRIRRVQRELSQARMMQAIPEADAVITNPVHLAVAIKYDYEIMDSPYVVAKGERKAAMQIREIAEEHGVPIVENPPLAQALYKNVEVGEAIPMEFYQAIAEVLAYVHELTNRYRGLSVA
ncbi:TPA: flagellar biosynthesis protein FlhB [Candidatus Poribacteria bacterium]|nr:flagellar biosynthesis protein FlhB [Candidatus Poribacteria bacterium]